MFTRILRYKLRRSVLVVAACCSLFAGIFWARATPLTDIHILWILLPALILSLRNHNVVTCVLLVLIFFVVGWWRGSTYVQKLAIHEAFHYRVITIVGQATDDAVYGKRYQLEFSLNNIQIVRPTQTPLVGGLTIRGYGESMVYRGDTVQATGKLYPTMGNNLGTISFASLQVTKRGDFWADNLRRRFLAGMQSALPEPVASFALGLLIGQRNTLPDDITTQLQHVGLTHVIAVSGYNLTVLVIACRRAFDKRSKFQTMAACITLICLFLLITGTSPPIVRASIISILGLWSWYYGRIIKPLVLLLTSAAITILANPLYAWDNVSWYLSFLAFAGVLLLGPLITERYFHTKEPPLLLGILIESACANIVVLPYILYIFGQVSLVSLPANLLIVPLVPLAMLFSLAAGMAGMFVPFLAGWIAWPAKIITTYMLDATQILSRVPHSFITNIGFSWVYLMSGYGIIIFVMLVLWHKTKSRSCIKSTSLRDN